MAVAVAARLPHFVVAALAGGGRADGFQPLAEAREDGNAKADALAAARGEAVAEAEAEFERRRAADLADYERRLKDREQEIAEKIGAALSVQLTEGIGRIEDALSGHVARILARFLEERVRRRALDELSETIAALLVGGAAKVRIAAPEPLASRLAALANGAAVATVAGDASEVTVTIDHTAVETGIGAWVQRLAVAVADGEDD